MAVTRIDIEKLLSFGSQHPVVDVRSEGEYEHARIPGAVSLPLFDNKERKIVGTAYKQQSKQQAIKIGFALFGKKMVDMVEFVEKLLESKDPGLTPKTVVVYCWRGGMRSGGVSWLLDMYGFKVYTLIGGYKAYRQWCLQQFEKDYPIKVLGGYTGSGKSYVLNEGDRLGKVTIELEELAKHKGSAFGNIGMPEQPSQEMFENLLALELRKADDKCKLTDERKKEDNRPLINENEESDASGVPAIHLQQPTFIWLEDESQRIGLVNIPTTLFKKMRSKRVYFLDIPFEERLKHILCEYGKCDKQELAAAIVRIQKRLGGLETKNALKYLMEENLEESFRILLKYYDKQYLKGLQSRENFKELICEVACETVDIVNNAKRIFTAETEIHD